MTIDRNQEVIGGLFPADFSDVVNVRRYPEQAAELIANMLTNTAQVFTVLGDEATALTVAELKTFRFPFTGSVAAFRASVLTAPTGAALIVDVKKNGVTMMATNKVQIDDGDTSSVGSTAPSVISDAGVTQDDVITIEVTQIGSTIAGAGLKLIVEYNSSTSN